MPWCGSWLNRREPSASTAPPGNAGTAEDGVNVPLDPLEFDRLVAFVRKEKIDLTVVGPEEPLCAASSITFRKPVYASSVRRAAAAQLESSKVFAKGLMRHADVPTSDIAHFRSS